MNGEDFLTDEQRETRFFRGSSKSTPARRDWRTSRTLEFIFSFTLKYGNWGPLNNLKGQFFFNPFLGTRMAT